jgi:malonyl-CoA decarboxylase
MARRSGSTATTTATRDAKKTIDMFLALLSERAEVSGRRLAVEALVMYSRLQGETLEHFLDLLAQTFAPDEGRIGGAIDAYRAQPGDATLAELQMAVESPRLELFRRLNVAPMATGALIDLRRKVRDTLKEHPDRSGIDRDLAHLFRSWFNRGFLVLRQIDWHSSAAILEKLIAYEAVHQIRDWHDLRRRLQEDRRCYAFFHPALPDEPLIFVEVALTRGMTGRVQPLLDADAPVGDVRRANAAIFYSITNCQAGLHGISFGNSLIKQVVEDLGRDLPGMRIFASLSPMPGFCRWLKSESTSSHLSPDLRQYLQALETPDSAVAAVPSGLKPEVLNLGARYLLFAKDQRRPVDSVARFHLANGARAERLNWMADASDQGMRQSLGLMVNYRYIVADLERNHEAFIRDGKIAASRQLQMIAATAPRRPLASDDRI